MRVEQVKCKSCDQELFTWEVPEKTCSSDDNDDWYCEPCAWKEINDARIKEL